MLHGRACFPPAITPAAGRPARCTVTVPGDTGSVGMWRLINNKLHRGSGGWPHPLPAFYRPRSRSDAPVTSRYTRSVAVHPIRRGAMPTDRVHRLTQQAQLRTLPPNTPQPARPHSLKMLTQAPNERRYTRYVALHPIRRGAMPTDRVHRYLQQVSVWRYASTPRRNTRQRSSAATEETVHHRETGIGDEAANSSTHQLLGHSTTRTTCACQRLRSLCGDNHTISSLLRHTSSHGR